MGGALAGCRPPEFDQTEKKMSGHSHWSKIKRAKGSNDARRGREWSKLSRRVIVAARAGGGNPDENLSLRYAMDECRAANMPNEQESNPSNSMFLPT